MKELISFFQISRTRMAFLIVLTVTAGLANTAILYLINEARKTQQGQAYPVAMFLFVFAVYVLSQRTVQNVLIDVSERTLREIRTGLIKRILACKYRALAETGEECIINGLTTDARTISRSVLILVSFVVSLITIVSCLTYLAYLSMRGFLTVALFTTGGVIVYALIAKGAASHLGRARKTEDEFLRHVRDLTLGSKELKLNRQRRAEFFLSDVSRACAAVEGNNRTARTRYMDGGLFGNGVFFLLIGMVALLFEPALGIPPNVRGGFIVVLLFLIAPISVLVTNLPVLNSAFISSRRLGELSGFLSEHREDSCNLEAGRSETVFRRAWKEISLEAVSYTSKSNDVDFAFHLGPIDLTIRAGETLFIVGGNGSGKSTLGKIITGLFVPESGTIAVDGVPVTEANRDDFRQLFSAVFSDYHLFPKLQGVNAGMLGKSEAILDRLEIAGRVTVANGRFNTATLSQGERKRLALAACCFEGRSIYFFDEWATDQDPVFKHYFYAGLVPSLKDSGGTIIAITHDDQYFHLSDRVLKLADGKLTPWNGARS